MIFESLQFVAYSGIYLQFYIDREHVLYVQISLERKCTEYLTLREKNILNQVCWFYMVTGQSGLDVKSF